MPLPDAMVIALERVLQVEEDYDETAACLISNLAVKTIIAWLRSDAPEAVEMRRRMADAVDRGAWLGTDHASPTTAVSLMLAVLALMKGEAQ